MNTKPKSSPPGDDRTPVRAAPRSPPPQARPQATATDDHRTPSPQHSPQYPSPRTADRDEADRIIRETDEAIEAIGRIVETNTTGTGKVVNIDNIRKVVKLVIKKGPSPDRVKDIFLLVNQKAKDPKLKLFSDPPLSTREISVIREALNVRGNTGGSRKKHRRNKPSKCKSRTYKKKSKISY